jgi:hypothetical protein
MKKEYPELRFDGIQIKSEEIFHRFCSAVNEIEQLCGIHETKITLSNIFFCPDIDREQCNKTPTERLVIGIIKGFDK